MPLTNPHELTRSGLTASSLTTETTSDHKSCACIAQTNEMHDQYLNRLEASFVTQLHRSTSFLARWSDQSMNRNSSVNQPDEKTSEQLTVFRDWCREKINFKTATTNDSRDVLKNPWVKHFKHGYKPCSTNPHDVDVCGNNHHENLLRDPRTSAPKIGRYSSDVLINKKRFTSVGSTSEGSGQNFVYENCENDVKFRVKKLKLSAADTSSADRIVPSDEIVAETHPLIRKISAEDQACSQSLSEYRNVVIHEPVLHCFHRQ